jgi:hypothetical protein
LSKGLRSKVAELNPVTTQPRIILTMSFQNPQIFQQTISLFPEQSTLAIAATIARSR